MAVNNYYHNTMCNTNELNRWSKKMAKYISLMCVIGINKFSVQAFHLPAKVRSTTFSTHKKPNRAALNIELLPQLVSRGTNKNGKRHSKNDNDIDDADMSFTPKFDGQLIYGLPVDENRLIETDVDSLRKISSKLGGSNTHEIINDESNSSDEARETGLAQSHVGSKSCSYEISPLTSFFTKDNVLKREQAVIRQTNCISRIVPLGIKRCDIDKTDCEELYVKIFEMEKPTNVVEKWMSGTIQDKDIMGDPFGVVMWPGSILAAQEMALVHLHDIRDKVVVVLGAGTGVEAQTAAMLGAKKVIATDINKFTLSLLKYGATIAGFHNIIETRGKFCIVQYLQKSHFPIVFLL